MAVKTIFKWLIGTVVIMVISALVIEAVNITLVSTQLNQLSRVAIRQACVFFSQETYKREDASSINMDDIKGIDGLPAVSGIFYKSSSPEDIYKDLYSCNDKFKTWTLSYDGVWNNLELIKMGIGWPSSLPLNVENYEVGTSYVDEQMTPLNLGITYLDKDTVQKIAQWNSAAIFSNGQQTMVVDNDGNDPRVYVKYKGFKIYVNNLNLNITYKKLNIFNDKDEFERLTNLDPTKLGVESPTDERANILIAGIDYTIPIAYEGVTPLKQIMQFAWNTGVKGINDRARSTLNMPYAEKSESELQAGGFNGNTTLPVPGTLIFFVVK